MPMYTVQSLFCSYHMSLQTLKFNLKFDSINQRENFSQVWPISGIEFENFQHLKK